MSYLNVVSMLIVSSLHCFVHVIFERCFYVDYVVTALLRVCHILDGVSMLIVSSFHCYVHIIFERCFYVVCVVILCYSLVIASSCFYVSIVSSLHYCVLFHNGTLFLCRLWCHYIGTVIWHLYVVSILVVSSLNCYVHVIFGRRFYVSIVSSLHCYVFVIL